MLSAENLAAIESEGRRLGLMASRDPDRPVPQYPGWTLADLASHTASIHARTTRVVTDLPLERIPAPALPTGVDPIDWYHGTLEGMLAALRDSEPTTPCWALGPEQCVGFWEVRMVMETGVHRWDAYQAFEEEDRLTDRVATAGLDEFAGTWLPRLGPVQTLEVRAIDLDRTWTYGGEEASASIEGTASELCLRLSARPSTVVLPDDWKDAVAGLTTPQKA